MATFKVANHHIVIRTVSLDVPSIAANTVSAETFVVPGLRTDMFPLVKTPNLTAGLVKMDEYVSATDELTIVFWNTTGAPINQAAQDVFLVAL